MTLSMSRVTQRYIREHPSIADCLERGLINYSALAREICASEQLEGAFDAVLVACRRLRAKHRERSRVQHERKIVSLIRRAKVRVHNKIAVVIVEKPPSLDRALQLQKTIREERGDFNLIEGEEVLTLVTNVDYLPRIREMFGSRIKKTTRGLVQITMLFDESLETVSGVVAYVYRLFAEHDINIREEMSCWTDIMVVIDERDIGKAMQVMGE